MAAYRAGEVEVLLTVDDKDVARAEKNVKTTGDRIEKKPITPKVDTTEAIAGMDRVETKAKKLVSERAVMQLDADIERAEKAMVRAGNKLEDLQVRAEGGLNVDADVRRAEAAMRRIDAQLDALRKAKTEIEIDVDAEAARKALEGVADDAEEAGDDGGKRGGKALLVGIVSGLASIPIVGAIAKIAHTAADTLVSEFQDALQIEVRQDRLQALTGIDEASAAKFARAAGEAYANNFGESIESNMDTTRLALQFDLIDENGTTRDAQKVVQSLGGIADVLQEDVGRTAQAVTVLLTSGLAKSADEAFDLIAAGAREGVNRGEDLLDTLIEYPSVLEKLGLSGEEMLGLLNQGLDAGARNSDVAADALKEFQIRATDASESSAKGFQRLGLDAEDMTARIAAGGESARDGLALVLDKLREIQDPVERNAAAVELFGTKAEDLGDALFAMDLSSAVDQLNGVTGAADAMFATLADNDASKIEQAQRNIEVAAEGIKGALASALSEPFGDFADFVSANRGPVLGFFQDLVNGAFDFGRTIINAAADGTEAFGEFVSGPLEQLVEGIQVAIEILSLGTVDTSKFDELQDQMRGFGDDSKFAADQIRDLEGGVDEAADAFNGFMDAQVALGFLNDASLRLAGALDQVDGASAGVESQVRNVIAALGDEVAAADAAGESQTNLTDRYNTATQALVDQMVQTGMSEEAARALIDTVLQTPAEASTEFGSNAPEEQGKVQALADRITTLPDGTVVVNADTSPAETSLTSWITSATGRRIQVKVDAVGGTTYRMAGSTVSFQAQGGVVEFMAGGGIRGGTAMDSLAQIVPPNTYRVVGDRGDVPELFAPLDGSARSWALLLEGLRRMPGSPGGDGQPAAQGSSGLPPIQVIHHGDNYSYDPTDIARAQREQLRRALDELPPM